MAQRKQRSNTFKNAGGNSLVQNQFYADQYNNLTEGPKRDGKTINLYTNNAAHKGMTKSEYGQALQEQMAQKLQRDKLEKQGFDGLKPNEITPSQLEYIQPIQNNQQLFDPLQQQYSYSTSSPDRLTKETLPQKQKIYETTSISHKHQVQYNAEQKSLVLNDDKYKYNIRGNQQQQSIQNSPQPPSQYISPVRQNKQISNQENYTGLQIGQSPPSKRDNKKIGLIQSENVDIGQQNQKQQQLQQWKLELDEQLKQQQMRKELEKQQRIQEDIKYEQQRFNEHQDQYQQYQTEQGKDQKKISQEMNQMIPSIPKDYQPRQQYHYNQNPNTDTINSNEKTTIIQQSFQTPSIGITSQFNSHNPYLWRPTGDFQPGRQDIEMLKGVINQQQDAFKNQLELLKQQVKEQAYRRDNAINDNELLQQQVNGLKMVNIQNGNLNHSKLQNILVPHQRHFSLNFDSDQNNIFNQNLYDIKHMHQQVQQQPLTFHPMEFDQFGRLLENQQQYGNNNNDQTYNHKNIGFDNYGNPQVMEQYNNDNMYQDINQNKGDQQLDFNSKMIHNENEFYDQQQQQQNSYGDQQQQNSQSNLNSINQDLTYNTYNIEQQYSQEQLQQQQEQVQEEQKVTENLQEIDQMIQNNDNEEPGNTELPKTDKADEKVDKVQELLDDIQNTQ